MTETQQTIINELTFKLGLIGGALTKPEVLSLYQEAVYQDERFRSNLTYLRDKLNEILEERLPSVPH